MGSDSEEFEGASFQDPRLTTLWPERSFVAVCQVLCKSERQTSSTQRRLVDGHAPESQSSHDGNEQQAAILIAEGGSHLVAARLDLLKEPLTDIVGAVRVVFQCSRGKS